jgi:hypothetical protein
LLVGLIAFAEEGEGHALLVYRIRGEWHFRRPRTWDDGMCSGEN